MNPLEWPAEHKIAFAIVVAIGSVAGVILGYFVYAAPAGAEGYSSFDFWLANLFGNRVRSGSGAHWWALFGAVISGAAFYARKLIK